MSKESESLTIGEGGVLTLPQRLLQEAHLHVGSMVDVSVEDDGTLAIAAASDEPPGWHEGLRESQQELADGKGDRYTNDEDFRAALLARMKPE